MDFLIENWKWLTAISLGLVELVLMLVFKRRPVISVQGLLDNILDWIKDAESKFALGSDKMSYVLERSKVYLGQLYNEKSVRAIVEFVLTLPEKKKEKFNEK